MSSSNPTTEEVKTEGKNDGRSDRPLIIGEEEGPESPFPLRMGGKVVSGFGRGSKELGIPTANIPVTDIPWISTSESGVYFGWAGIKLPEGHPQLSASDEDSKLPSTTFTSSHLSPSPSISPPSEALSAGWRLYPMCMSIGFNPFYKNTVRSAEVHIMHHFSQDFYGSEMRIALLGFIRKELDYVSLEALVEDIRKDIEVSGRSLGREAWRGEKAGVDAWLWGVGNEWMGSAGWEKTTLKKDD